MGDRTTWWLAAGAVLLLVVTVMTFVRSSDSGARGGADGPLVATTEPAPDEGAEALAARSRTIIDEYLRRHPTRKLMLGAGSTRREGWLATDIEAGEGLAYLDATARFPFDDQSFHFIASEHVIEHLPFEGGANMLAESFRVLVPGGRIRIATPDLQKFVSLFQPEKTPEMRSYIAGKLAWHDWPAYASSETIILNLQMSSWGHRFLYDQATLRAALERAGFVGITPYGVGASDTPELRGIEGRQFSPAIAVLNEYETMVVEASRPHSR